MPIFRKGMMPLPRLWKLRRLTISSCEQELRDNGYWPGAETYNFRLWWNDDDERVIEERGRDDEREYRRD